MSKNEFSMTLLSIVLLMLSCSKMEEVDPIIEEYYIKFAIDGDQYEYSSETTFVQSSFDDNWTTISCSVPGLYSDNFSLGFNGEVLVDDEKMMELLNNPISFDRRDDYFSIFSFSKTENQMTSYLLDCDNSNSAVDVTNVVKLPKASGDNFEEHFFRITGNFSCVACDSMGNTYQITNGEFSLRFMEVLL